MSYQVEAYIYDFYDGDTVYYHADLGYNTMITNQVGRLLGIDAPEIRPLVTREIATQSRDSLITLIKMYALNRGEPSERLGHKVILRSHKMTQNYTMLDSFGVTSRDNFGRWLVELEGRDDRGRAVNLNDEMVQSRYAVVWFPGMVSDFSNHPGVG